MKHLSSVQSALWLALLATQPVMAQSPAVDSASSVSLDVPPIQSPNRFGFSYRMGFNVPVSFKNLGGFPALSNARRTLDGDLYNYDNGYVLTDSSGNAMGLTRYWGYDNASQVPGNGFIVMQRSSSSATASSNDHDDAPMSGFELTYERELVRKKAWHGGLEGAFGYSYMSVRDAGSELGTVTRVSDSYAIPQGNGFVLPPPGYTGRKSLPGPVIAGSPSSSTTAVQQDASIVGERDFSADLFNVRLGPYVEIPISKSIAFKLSGGLALMYVDSEFSFDETVTVPGAGTIEHHASGTGNGLLVGGYVAGSFSVALSDAWSFVAGAQFEDLGRYTQSLSGKAAVLDLSQAIFVTVGLTYSF